jgi:dihydroflavonol-4-reductase
MKVYVTGATGFVGKILVKKLDELGFDTWAIVRNRTIREKEISLDFNTCSESEIYEKISDANCIVHLAAHADFRQDFSEEIYRINCLGTIALANVAKELNAHFILASNALIAGMRQEYINQYSKDQPDIPYNIAKYLAEEYIIQQLKHYTILRIGGIYGYNGPEHLFLNRAINKVIDYHQIPDIQNDGLGRRNYIYVDDLCKWIIKMIEHKITGKYLTAGVETLSLKEIFTQLNQIFLESKSNFATFENISGTDQIIEIQSPNIEMHTYLAAFSDIKKQVAIQ